MRVASERFGTGRFADSNKEKFQDLLSKMFEPPFDARPSLLSASHSRLRDADLAARYRQVMTHARSLGELDGLCGDVGVGAESSS